MDNDDYKHLVLLSKIFSYDDNLTQTVNKLNQLTFLADGHISIINKHLSSQNETMATWNLSIFEFIFEHLLHNYPLNFTLTLMYKGFIKVINVKEFKDH
jgi:hypothetical protein